VEFAASSGLKTNHFLRMQPGDANAEVSSEMLK
jgi:hypothetical protein